MSVPEGISGQQRRVLELRDEFLRKSLNPYRHATMEGGHVVSKNIKLRLDNSHPFNLFTSKFIFINFSSIQHFTDSKLCVRHNGIILKHHQKLSDLDS